ncbi:hypothetical protein B0T22DRAFT_286119 [Podospora appendiculata]|uniref:Uncharacterized protein n=1 Tax=Podospora appendiculata TaxID=314037 RepID=A0AAE0X0W3_9PEZI|nr:hypothetical protein B0T22DRAFT_286119 [Podospora appendiculata]
MPPLHKSFSEQNSPTSKRAQPQWQRSKSNPMAKVAPPKPLLPVSETTRNKLHAFQFEPQPESDDVAPKAPAAVAAAPPSGKENISPPRPRKPSPSNNAHIATTPVTRLTWQDLLGNQGLPKEEDKDVSPSERILWLNDRGPASMAMSPMVARKGRKRARSSSPISSPAAPKCSPNIDVKGLTRVLKTPHTDPALELWDRFSLPGTEGSPSGLTNPLLAHLMIPSSPRPSKDGSAPPSERTLRKAISCGSHWPKRRKTERSDAAPGAILEGSPRRNAKSSMVSALLETVDGELRKSKSVEAQVEQLRSPSPQKRPPPKRKTDTPNQSRLSPTREEMEDDGVDQGPEATSAGNVSDAGKPGAPIEISSSDYGDDDFDEDTLVELDATLQMVQGHVTAAPVLEPARRQPSPSTVDEDFGDLDDDLLDEAVDLITKLEASQPLLGLSQAQQQGKLAAGIGGDDDDFGDDFGEGFDFDAAERAAAVQPAARVAPPSTHVRTLQ